MLVRCTGTLGRCGAATLQRPSVVSLDEEINPRFYRGKKKSFSIRFSEGKQILESKRLNEKEI